MEPLRFLPKEGGQTVTEMDPQTEIGPEKTEGSEVPDHAQAGRQGERCQSNHCSLEGKLILYLLLRLIHFAI